MREELVYQIGLTLIDGIGDVNAKSLLAYCGSAREVFRQKKSHLQKIPGIGEILAGSVANSGHVLKRAEEECKFIEKYNIRALFFTDESYPSRLKYCSDGPILLYYKGSADLNKERIVGIVGTRKPSDYGRKKTIELVSELEQSQVLVVSGLAYGVDITAHKTALEYNMQTVGVLAHGLDRIYPQIHDKIAKKMLRQGGLLTDFMSGTNPDAVNFPKRNRIVAGLCDAIVVVESKRTGGSLITATIAGSYNRDVFAFPGKAGDVLAEGCNGLIKRNKAVLIESAADLLDAMQWVTKEKRPNYTKQLPLQLELTPAEKSIISAFATKAQLHIDEICAEAELPVSKASAALLQLEFQNIIRSKPGKLYELV